MKRHGWRTLVSGLVLVAGITTIGQGVGRAEGAGPPTLEARATAEGGRFGFAVPGFAVVEQIIDGGGPVADARIDARDFRACIERGFTHLKNRGLG